MKLTPSDPSDPLALLRDAKYGYERDDHDGYEFAKTCTELALKILAPKRYWITERSSGHYKVQTHSETGSIYTVCECYYAREAERMRDLLEASD